jgi:pyruvate dehydrogenase E1 component alpha subunit
VIDIRTDEVTASVLDESLLVEMLTRMMRIRSFDLKVEELHRSGQIPGAIHTSLGQEGEIVGASLALRPDDYMVGNHRSHGHPIAKGAAVNPLMSELFGKATGVNRGKGGSMHLADFSVGNLGETSIVGAGIPIAAGVGLAEQLRDGDRVCLCYFGDGAANEGDFHEGLNLAGVWKLPVVYLCENNLYASGTRTSDVTATGEDVAVRASSYNMPGVVVDGQDVHAVYAVVSEAVARARRGDGATLVEAKTYRSRDHASNLGSLVEARSDDEVEHWAARDPIVLHRDMLLNLGVLTIDELESLARQISEEIQDAVDFARRSPYPEAASIYEHVVSGGFDRGVSEVGR